MAEEARHPDGVARLHVLPRASGLVEAARFLVSSLLVSHGVRRDSMATVGFEDGRWLYVYGSSVRHLRPDIDSAVGFVKAVMRGARLGASLSAEPPGVLGECILLEPGGDVFFHERIPWGPPVTIYYSRPAPAGCSIGGTPQWLPRRLAPGVANALIDMVWGYRGLPFTG